MPKKITTTHYESPGAGGITTEIVEDRTDFDAFGHHQESVISGNGVGLSVRTLTDYASDNDPSQGCAAPDLMANWLGNVVASTRTFQDDPQSPGTWLELSRTEYGFDVDRGLVEETVARKSFGGAINTCLADPVAAVGDIVTARTYTDGGDLETETVFTEQVSGDSFSWKYTYADGVVRSKQNLSAEIGYFDFVRVVDPDTGLTVEEQTHPTSDTDPTGKVSTYHQYDILGRPTRLQVGVEEPTRRTFNHVARTAPGAGVRLDSVTTYRGTGDDRTELTQHYDGRERVTRSDQLRPDGSMAYQYFDYDHAGRPSFTSVWTGAQSKPTEGTTTSYTGSCTNPPLGQTECEDPFGRPRTVEAPLNATGLQEQVTEYLYFGTNKSVTVQNVAVAGDGLNFDTVPDAPTTSSFYTDGLGRLRIVVSPDTDGTSQAASDVADAVYDYDGAGRLLTVNLIDDVTISPTGSDRYAVERTSWSPQVRSFTYDNLGRQTSATHPENGLTTTTAWNALGSPTAVQDAMGLAGGYEHRTTYDAAGRPTKTERSLVNRSQEFIAVYPASSSSAWTSTNFDFYDLTDPSVADCLTEAAWYIGVQSGDDACRYAVSSALTATLELSTPVSIPLEGAQLSFRYFREVRESITGNVDNFKIWASTDGGSTWNLLYRLDSRSLSWSRWKHSPVIELPAAAYGGTSTKIKFEFNGATNPTPTKGLAISEIRIERPWDMVLSETLYDEDFSIGGNRPRGKPTTIRKYDESTQAVAFEKKLHYLDVEGHLTKELTSIDWDRDGVFSDFEATYSYDSFGRLATERLPYLAGATDFRSLDYLYRHGAQVGATGSVTLGTNTLYNEVIPDSVGTPGIEYNASGGISKVRYGNGLETRTASTPGFLPEQIVVDRGLGGTALFDTGTYVYDGAGNIRRIGSDVYRYDMAGRLRRAKVTSSDFPAGLFLDYDYDIWGNMLGRQTGIVADQTAPYGPDGLYFTGRQYTDNRIAESSGYYHDANGNLIRDDQPMKDNAFVFSPENEMWRVQEAEGTKPATVLQESRYDPAGDRYARMVLSEGSVTLLTLRDASGQVAAEYMDTPGGSGDPELYKQYVHAGRGLAAVHSDCGPAPELIVVDVTATDLVLQKNDFTPPVGNYTIAIQTESGAVTTITDDSNMPDQFTIPLTSLSSTENTWIRLQAMINCGNTGYSNAVSFNQEANPLGCVESAAVANIGAEETGTYATLQIRGHHTCDPGMLFKALYSPEAGGPPVELGSGLSSPSLDLPGTGLTAGHGVYSFVEQDPVTGVTGIFFGHAIRDDRLIGNGSGQVPGESTFKTEYIHADHLGSTRLVTDEMGVVVKGQKFYPFGHEAETVGMNRLRMKFTGHERDEQIGLDYMKARFCGPSLGRFLNVDPFAQSAVPHDPQSWNRFAYVLNNPTNAVDPDGEDPFFVSRPLGNDPRSSIAHTFVVHDAAFVGDPNAVVRSFGDRGDGRMGEVFNDTLGRSAGTAQSDRLAWNSLSLLADGNPDVAVVAIPATDRDVRLAADSVVSGSQRYSPTTIGPVGVNSNSAAKAIADRAAGRPVPVPGERRAQGAGAAGEVVFERSGDPAHAGGCRSTCPLPAPEERNEGP